MCEVWDGMPLENSVTVKVLLVPIGRSFTSCTVRLRVRVGLRLRARRAKAMLLAPSLTVRVEASEIVPVAICTSPAEMRPPSSAYTVTLAAIVVDTALETSLVGAWK